jgi:hypothetical protein
MDSPDHKASQVSPGYPDYKDSKDSKGCPDSKEYQDHEGLRGLGDRKECRESLDSVDHQGQPAKAPIFHQTSCLKPTMSSLEA